MVESPYSIQVMSEQEDKRSAVDFFGSLGALFDEFKSDTDHRRIDDEIMSEVAGIFDKASTYYSNDKAQQLALMSSLAEMLDNMACSHDHFAQQLEVHGMLPRVHSDEDDDKKHVQSFSTKPGNTISKSKEAQLSHGYSLAELFAWHKREVRTPQRKRVAQGIAMLFDTALFVLRSNEVGAKAS
jgi:hypothetical protein